MMVLACAQWGLRAIEPCVAAACDVLLVPCHGSAICSAPFLEDFGMLLCNVSAGDLQVCRALASDSNNVLCRQALAEREDAYRVPAGLQICRAHHLWSTASLPLSCHILPRAEGTILSIRCGLHIA